MALFVAKLLDSGPKEGAEAVPVFSHHREPFRRKLERTLKQGSPQSNHTRLSDEFRAHLSTVLSRERFDVAVAPSWPVEQLELFRQVPLSNPSDPEQVLSDSIEYFEQLIHTERKKQQALLDAQKARTQQLTSQMIQIYRQGPRMHAAFSGLVEEMKGLESLMTSHAIDIRKSNFLESVVECVSITDYLHSVPEGALTGSNANLLIDQLAKAAGLSENLIGRSRDIISARLVLLNRRFVETIIAGMDGDQEKRVQMYVLLKRFQHEDPHKALSVFLAPKLEKFSHHFIRKGSALNVVDRPEWPLRWLLELAQETSKILEDQEEVHLFLAGVARDYYRRHRWGLIRNPRSESEADLFSLYLAKYIASVVQWTDAFGAKVQRILLQDILENLSVGSEQWMLLDEWIYHDYVHIENVIRSTKNLIQPSQFNPEICTIIQTLEDVMESSKARLQCVYAYNDVAARFREECHDQAVESLMYNLRVQSSEELTETEADLVQRSMLHFKSFLDSQDVCSLRIRRKVADFSKFI